MSARNIVRLVVSLIVCFGAAGVGGLAMGEASLGWYRTLQRPALSPPSWVFAPVWTLLYLLMAVALYLVWSRVGQAGVTLAVAVFAIQLVLNAAWTPAFFGMQSPLLGLAVIVPLWALILTSTVLFWRIVPLAGALLLPYLAWVSFASYLNAGLYVLNR